ncbi:hypothetical protein T4A_1363 [Trichinella pseudospiralis]|uniref:Uncharacterized protein n=1 Tax=Trichinella pseudospiralis TaxID=6337 RepID=A0A0V1EVB2_TRIPS|nr:hypothetical protein T4A_1363 [Trichinella pseudospiralis]
MSVGPAQTPCNRSIQYFSADPLASYVPIRLFGLVIFLDESFVEDREKNRSGGSVFVYIENRLGCAIPQTVQLSRGLTQARYQPHFTSTLFQQLTTGKKQGVQLALRNRCFRTRSNVLLPREFLDSDGQFSTRFKSSLLMPWDNEHSTPKMYGRIYEI